MSRGRHSLPAAPRSPGPLLIVGLLVLAAAIAAVWWVGESLTVRVAATAVLVVVAFGAALAMRAAHQTTTALWREATERRRELVEVQRELVELRSQHVELLLELRALRVELAAASQETARSIQAATDQQALMRDLLTPRPPVPDPVYPSMHLPLVRAAFSSEVPPKEPAAPPPSESYPQSDESSGGEPFPPRQLLDLTASEIARLRPAN
jgi:hypothetical protein